MTEKKAPYDVNAARAVLMEARKAQTSGCWAKIQKALEEDHCTLNGEPVLVSSPAGYVIGVTIWASARED